LKPYRVLFVTRVVFVHGSVAGGETAWTAQQPLAARWETVFLSRPGFPPGPPAARIDFEEHTAWLAQQLRAGDQLVGHSYGGVVSLLAAPGLPLASLTVIEPPAFRLALGDPVADSLVRELEDWWRDGPADPRAFLAGFGAVVGSSLELPDPLPPWLAQGAQALQVERFPWTADLPLAALAADPYPKLVVSGAHSRAFDAVCDVLERELGAERAVVPGAGHSVPRAPGFNETLERFLRAAQAL
jgi:pimeloyl-ACP methyl ester carboxylesterase